jgi:uncharacterized protein (TIGR00299 family) protein
VRVAHFDCFSGISGDMTVAALIDAGVAFEAIKTGVDALNLPIQLEVEKVRKGGFAATYFRVEAPAENTHRFLPDIEAILQRGRMTDRQHDLALRIFRRLAEAEAAVHGMPVDKVHFHEVGALDSIADIVAAAIGLDLLGVDRFTSGPVAVGGGMVQCAHGLMPVPTPATAELLKGAPWRSTAIQAELTTPTGAAILATVVDAWVDQPAMTIERIGHGAGKRNFPDQPNMLRLFLGATAEAPVAAELLTESDRIWVLETNLDDMSGEVIGYCYDLLLTAGALDVFTTPIFMKKNRPGVLLSVLAPASLVTALEEILFRETTTLGVRRYEATRSKLRRRACTVRTPWGPIMGKLAWLAGRPPVFSPEFDDCARIAREHGLALRAVCDLAHRSFLEQGGQLE